MTINDFKNKRVVVMGLGLNQGGLGVSKWLLKHGARLLITDLKNAASLASSVAALDREWIRLSRRFGKNDIHRPRYVLGRHRLEDFRRADVVIQGPGVPRGSEFIAAALTSGATVETDMSIFFKLCSLRIIGVSGTRGKTTTVAMIGEMLKRRYGRAVVAGNIRRSPLDDLDRLIASRVETPVVLELSSWQLEGLGDAHASPHIAILTNVLPDHLNRYRDMRAYAAAKELIYANQTVDDIAIVPRDNVYTRKMGPRVPSERVWAAMKMSGTEENLLAYRGKKAVLRLAGKETILFEKGDVTVPGEHNLWNALLAAGTAYVRGARPAHIRAALRSFKGVPHRLERLGVVNGVAYWNDTAATNPDGSVAAMKTLARRKNLILIAGGSDKNIEFKEWAVQAKASCKAAVLLPGTATDKMLPLLRKRGLRPIILTKSMSDAVAAASDIAKKGDIVALSPGAASFGLFINEFDRGEQFRKAVKRLR